MNELKNQTVLVLGLGISGLAMARWCVRCGAQVTVADTRATPPQLAALRAECPDVRFRSGPLDEALGAEAPWTLIARSPGLPPHELAPLRDWAQANGAAWVGELDLFAQALRDLSQRERLPYHPQVLAITGTNGKTTVTSLTGLLLQRAGVRTAVAGNIGPALLDVLAQALDAEMEAEQAAEPIEAEQPPETASEWVDASAVDSTAAEAHTPADDAPTAEAGEEDLDTDEQDGEDGEAPMLVPPPAAPMLPPHLPAVWVLEVSSFQLDGVAGGAWDARAHRRDPAQHQRRPSRLARQPGRLRPGQGRGVW